MLAIDDIWVIIWKQEPQCCSTPWLRHVYFEDPYVVSRSWKDLSAKCHALRILVAINTIQMGLPYSMGMNINMQHFYYLPQNNLHFRSLFNCCIKRFNLLHPIATFQLILSLINMIACPFDKGHTEWGLSHFSERTISYILTNVKYCTSPPTFKWSSKWRNIAPYKSWL